MKKCSSCQEMKSTDCFGKNKYNKDDLQCERKDCRKKNYEKYQKTENIKAHRRSNRYKELIKIAKSKYPEKRIAVNRWNTFKDKHKIIMSPNYDAHHFNYNKPLDVIFLPRGMHSLLHTQIDYDAEAKCYTSSGSLLDTLDKNLEFIETLAAPEKG